MQWEEISSNCLLISLLLAWFDEIFNQLEHHLWHDFLFFRHCKVNEWAVSNFFQCWAFGELTGRRSSFKCANLLVNLRRKLVENQIKWERKETSHNKFLFNPRRFWCFNFQFSIFTSWFHKFFKCFCLRAQIWSDGSGVAYIIE